MAMWRVMTCRKLSVGSDEVAVERDFYQCLRWVRVSGTWYSGTNDDWLRSVLKIWILLLQVMIWHWMIFLLPMWKQCLPVINLRNLWHYVNKEYKVDKEGKKYKLSDFGDLILILFPMVFMWSIMRNQKSILFQGDRTYSFAQSYFYQSTADLLPQRCKS